MISGISVLITFLVLNGAWCYVVGETGDTDEIKRGVTESDLDTSQLLLKLCLLGDENRELREKVATQNLLLRTNMVNGWCPGQYYFEPEYNLCWRIGWGPSDRFEAEKVCRREGAHLIVLNTLELHSYIHSFLQSAKTDLNFHIGGSDMGHEGAFKWSNGEPVRGIPWYPNEPNNRVKDGEEQDCIFLWKAHDYKLTDMFCSSKQGFLCQIDERH